MTHSLLLLVLDALAAYRLTRLLVDDAVAAPIRDALVGRAHADGRDLSGHRPVVAARPRMAEFLTCPWCVSIWMAAGVVAVQSLIGDVWFYAACVLAFSAVTGLIAERS